MVVAPAFVPELPTLLLAAVCVFRQDTPLTLSPTNGRISTRVHWEKEAGGPQVCIQLLAGHPCLNPAVHVACMDLESGWHMKLTSYSMALVLDCMAAMDLRDM